jgi:hypothetical protein
MGSRLFVGGLFCAQAGRVSRGAGTGRLIESFRQSIGD